MFDCHIHSNFSGDSEMMPETACIAAIKLGLEGIAFTDHLDYDYPDFDIEFLIDFDKYSIFIDNLKTKYDKTLKVLKGIEVGIQPHTIEATNNTLQKYDFDFVIASIHVIDGLDPYTGRYFAGKTKQQAYTGYLEAILHSVAAFNDFDVVGHIGYIRRYGDYEDRTLRHKDYSDILDQILKTVILKGKGLEINSSGYRGNLDSPMPDYDIVRRYKELGGEIISLGSDAHYPEHIAMDFARIKEKLLDIGFKYTTHFENRKPVFDKIL